jgi:Rrf2 family protein
MFAIKRETDYAIQLVQFLAAKKDKFVSLKDFSDISGISFWFLQKIARKLNLARIIEAEQGVMGGYRLKKTNKKLTLLKIFEIMEGKLAVAPCLGAKNYSCCGKNKDCKNKKMSARLNRELVKVMQKVKI